ncbi:hypothetical protein G7Y82_17040 [Solimonas sp. C16B3]|uniref:Tetratricopeptide repeat protein n=2 Tax=Solimonas marina TaxID=2714601 RepID=A0A970B7T2_9GAMM|nr:hypothetical protein [Solimonas marina]
MAGATLLLSATASYAADTLRPEVGKPLQEAQADMKARKYSSALADVDKAAAVGNLTEYESYIVAQMRAAIATAAGDEKVAVSAYEKVIASSRTSAAQKLQIYDTIAKLAYSRRDYSTAAAYIRKYQAAGGSSAQTIDLLPQALYLGNDLSGAKAALNAQIQNKKPTETQLQMLTSIAVKQKDDAGYIEALEKLVRYYPKKDYWLDLIARTTSKGTFASSRLQLDVYRLKSMTGTMQKASDYMEAAQLALQEGLPGEAEQYVDAGYKAKLLGVGSDAARHKRLKDLVDKKVAEDKATMAQGDKAAAAQASGDALVAAGLNHVGYGEAAAGVKMMEQGIKKDSLKNPNDAKLHLGYAQIKAGDKSGALRTLRSVGGSDGTADLSRLFALAAA